MPEPSSYLPESFDDVCVLRGHRWYVENHFQKQSILLKNVSQIQSVWVCDCGESRIKVPSKCTSVTIDRSQKCEVRLSDVIGAVNIINCKNLDVWLDGTCGTITLDSCSNVQVHLSNESIGCMVVTYVTDGLRVFAPGAPEEGMPVCNYWKSKFDPIHKCVYTAPNEAANSA